MRLPGNVWDFGHCSGGRGGPTENEDHPARFPYRLARDAVLCFSNEGDLVVDPFVGSGTSLIAALDHDRRFLGGDNGDRERDGKPWVDIARDIAAGRYAQMMIGEVA